MKFWLWKNLTKFFLPLFFIAMTPVYAASSSSSLNKSDQISEIKPTSLVKKKQPQKNKKNLAIKKDSFEKRESIKQLPQSTPLKKVFPATIENLTVDKSALNPTIIDKKHVILLDPGHGANDEGAKMYGCIEKNLCLLTALHLKNLLQSRGYKIILTRAHDEFVSLDKRVDIANQANCALFVSIHYNAAKSKEASGVEIFYPKHQDSRQQVSKQLAQNVLQKMIVKTGAKSRGVKAGNYHVIRETKMPAILIEGGFMTHPIEGQMLGSLNYIQQLSEGIADGIEYFCSTHFGNK